MSNVARGTPLRPAMTHVEGYANVTRCLEWAGAMRLVPVPPLRVFGGGGKGLSVAGTKNGLSGFFPGQETLSFPNYP